MMMTLGPLGWVALVGSVSALISLLTLANQSAPDDALEDLTFRLQHPIRHALAHTFRAMMRRYGR